MHEGIPDFVVSVNKSLSSRRHDPPLTHRSSENGDVINPPRILAWASIHNAMTVFLRALNNPFTNWHVSFPHPLLPFLCILRHVQSTVDLPTGDNPSFHNVVPVQDFLR